MQKRDLYALLVVALVVVFACSKNNTPLQPQVDNSAITQQDRSELVDPNQHQTITAGSQNFAAVLSGGEEVPPVTTDAFGAAAFHFARNHDMLAFRLSVRSLDNVMMAHVHLAATGVNGPVVLWLYPDSPPPVLIPGEFNGVLAARTVTSADLVGPLAGMTLEDLMTEMENGNAYVNIHTSQFGGGEIRGQIFGRGHLSPSLTTAGESVE